MESYFPVHTVLAIAQKNAIFVAKTNRAINILTRPVSAHRQWAETGRVRMLIARFVLATKIAFFYAQLVQYELESKIPYVTLMRELMTNRGSEQKGSPRMLTRVECVIL